LKEKIFIDPKYMEKYRLRKLNGTESLVGPSAGLTSRTLFNRASDIPPAYSLPGARLID
jgi:hypothetical protein